MKARLAFAALLVMAGCSSGRTFKEPQTLSDYHAERTVSPTAPADDAFRATPPKLLPRRPPPEAKPVEATLSNGIHVVMLERHDFPGVTADLVIDRGFDGGLPRAAELYARAFTRASTLYDRNASNSYLQHVGAAVNGSVDRDLSVLRIDALAPLFVSALSRAAPLFYSPLLANEDLDDARTKSAAERVRARDVPDLVGGETLLEAVFPPHHPYGRTLYGVTGRQSADVSNDAVRLYRDTLTGAEHMGVAVVGDFNAASMQTWLESALGKIPTKAKLAAEPVPDVPPKAAPKLIVINRPSAVQSNVFVGFRGPRASDPNLVPVEVLARAAAGELSTRLSLTLRKELGATYGVHMSVVGYRAGGLLEITTALDTAHTTEALQKMLTELGRFRTEPLGPSELASAKLRAYHPLTGGSTGGLASFLGRGLARGASPATILAHDIAVDGVTSESVQAAANQYLAADGMVIVIVGDASKLSGLGALGLGEPQIIRN